MDNVDSEKELPKRKSTRLKYFDYSAEGAYFITICTRDRKRILSDIVEVGEGLAPPEYIVRLKSCGKVAMEQLRLIKSRFPSVDVDEFVIMPDHIHATFSSKNCSGVYRNHVPVNFSISFLSQYYKSDGDGAVRK